MRDLKRIRHSFWPFLARITQWLLIWIFFYVCFVFQKLSKNPEFLYCEKHLLQLKVLSWQQNIVKGFHSKIWFGAIAFSSMTLTSSTCTETLVGITQRRSERKNWKLKKQKKVKNIMYDQEGGRKKRPISANLLGIEKWVFAFIFSEL